MKNIISKLKDQVTFQYFASIALLAYSLSSLVPKDSAYKMCARSVGLSFMVVFILIATWILGWPKDIKAGPLATGRVVSIVVRGVITGIILIAYGYMVKAILAGGKF